MGWNKARIEDSCRSMKWLEVIISGKKKRQNERVWEMSTWHEMVNHYSASCNKCNQIRNLIFFELTRASALHSMGARVWEEYRTFMQQQQFQFCRDRWAPVHWSLWLSSVILKNNLVCGMISLSKLTYKKGFFPLL